MHMDKKYFVGCRVDKQLFNKVKTHDEQSSTIVRKALSQYFKEGGTQPTSLNYDRELINVLNNQVDDLKQDKRVLNDQVNMLMLSSIPWLSKLKMKLLK